MKSYFLAHRASLHAIQSLTRRWQSTSAAVIEATAYNETAGQEAGASASGLAAPHPSPYLVLRPSLLPEAFQKLHNAFYLPKQGGRQQSHGEEGGGAEPRLPRKGGCKGLQEEMKLAGVFSASSFLDASVQGGAGSEAAAAKDSKADAGLQGPAVMWRPCFNGLRSRLQLHEGHRALLTGPPGSGKSVALATFVEQCRASDWLVLYVPSATALTSGGYFVPRTAPSALGADASAATSYDTIFSAQHILLGMQQAHGSKLASLLLQRKASEQLLKSAGWTPSTAAATQQDGKPNEAVANGTGAHATQNKPTEKRTDAASTGPQAAQVAKGLAHDVVHSKGDGLGSRGGKIDNSASGEGLTESASDSGSVMSSSKEGSSIGDRSSESSVSGKYGTLLDLVMAGLSSDTNAALAVDACLALISELDSVAKTNQARVLLAIDNYNALGVNAHTGYGVWEGTDPELGGPRAAAQEGRLKRRRLRVHDLTLARAFRLLGSAYSQRACHANVLCALSGTDAPSVQHQDNKILFSCVQEHIKVPHYTQTEIGHALHHYYKCGVLPHPPSFQQAKRMLALTNGSGVELRRLMSVSHLLGSKKDNVTRFQKLIQQPAVAAQ